MKYATTGYNALLWLLMAVASVAIIRVSVVNVDWIASGSMLPEYRVNNHIVFNQLEWGLNLPFTEQQLIQWKLPVRGEIVVFRNPFDDGSTWMKRVIGVPGDVVEYRNRRLFVNGIACSTDSPKWERLPLGNGRFSEPYRVWPSYQEQNWGPVHVAEGELFLMGDHRSVSEDSRVWGTIPASYLSSKPVLRVWPLNTISWL